MSLANSLMLVQQKVRDAERRANRITESVQILAVTKTISAEIIRESFGLGLKRFAENYVQEIRKKIEDLSDLDIEWHFIGNLQSNKVKFLVDRMAYIHSVSGLKLAQEISKRSMRTQKIMCEVNLANEKSKDGISAQELPQFLLELQKFENLSVVGLMFMPPPEQNDAQQRQYFSEARKLKENVTRYLNHQKVFCELSMGTSYDYENAILEGATMIRLGTVLFGERVYE